MKMGSQESSSSSSKIDKKTQKFIPPGTLARLRDSRRSSLVQPRPIIEENRVQFSLPTPVNTEPSILSHPAPAAEGVPCFLTGASVPDISQRKRIVAPKSMILVSDNRL